MGAGGAVRRLAWNSHDGEVSSIVSPPHPGQKSPEIVQCGTPINTAAEDGHEQIDDQRCRRRNKEQQADALIGDGIGHDAIEDAGVHHGDDQQERDEAAAIAQDPQGPGERDLKDEEDIGGGEENE